MSAPPVVTESCRDGCFLYIARVLGNDTRNVGTQMSLRRCLALMGGNLMFGAMVEPQRFVHQPTKMLFLSPK